ncbi:Rqc2 family fibronectin-binding protein [Desulfofalx alkaliphila]|uniref:Rqc2 family fibronectin-binding protein n=1 Tax=Desulfofalx alkaliphila TaxID=105483 RepID=UPI0004E0E9B9|nr:NFACT RNA binding domain-containing protein [Desulfofalx alkaliphila]
MPYDGLVMAAVCHELNKELLGARIDKIFQPLKEELALLISKPGTRYRLTISANANNARVHLTKNSKPNPEKPPVFCMVLRKHLEGARFTGIQQTHMERILNLDLATRDELGRPAVKTLVVEIMGKHSNIILLDKESKVIIDGIKRYSHGVSRHREVLPGRDYLPPPDQGKVHPINLNEDRFFDIITTADLDMRLKDILLNSFNGFSPRMCSEIVYRCGLSPNTTLNHCGEYELRLLWNHFNSITSGIEGGKFNPTAVYDENGKPVDFAAFELTQFAGYEMQGGSMNEVLDQFYAKKEHLQLKYSKAQSLQAVIGKDLARLKKKLPLYQKSLKEAGRGDDFRIFGELLTAYMYQLTKGMNQVRLENFYHPELTKVTIDLDPQKTPSENAQYYFKKYVKSKNTLKAVQEQLKQAQQELNYLESIETAILQATNLSQLEEIETELISQGYIKAKRDHKKKDRKGLDKPQPLAYTSSDGFTILVGKNNRQNDYLTLRTAQSHDLWLHTKDIPGSHVVIRTEGRTVPTSTLEEAAILAAYHSKARQSGSVPVDYTYIKHVRKPSGAKPGMVIYDNQQTIRVNPDEGLVARLIQ